VNHQLRPWICTNRPNSFPNLMKYKISPWICQTSIKMVPPSKCSATCCVALYTCQQGSHVYKDQFDGNDENFSFHFTTSIFSIFPVLPLFYPYLPPSDFTLLTSNTSLTFLLHAKSLKVLPHSKQRWIVMDNS